MVEYKGEERRVMITKHEVDIATIKAEIESIKEVNQSILLEIKEIKVMLLGNGKTGICSKVNILWASSLFLITSVIIIGLKVFIK